MSSENLTDLDLFLARAKATSGRRGYRSTAPEAVQKSGIPQTSEGPMSYNPTTPTEAPGSGAPNPPVGRGGGPAYGQTPFGGYEAAQGLSPQEQRSLEIAVDADVRKRIEESRSIAPSARQQTQGELINLTLLYQRLGNPFSVRRIPFSVLRDMLMDPMIGFALHFTDVPIVRAPYYIECPDAQIAAFIDAAIRPINPKLQISINGKLPFGYQPMCKRFKLEPLRAFYRDPNGKDPDKDIPVWDSSIEPLVWDDPMVLAPEHCMPRWNQRGEFAGFYYSIVPLPNPIQIGLANLYGYSVVPGFEITQEFALWPVNDQIRAQGSIYGIPRVNRAYRYFWCNPPEAPILMGDYSLKPLGEIVEGDEIIGWEAKFGREASGLYAPRDCLTKAIVKSVSRRRAQMVKVTFKSGHVIRCTPDHLWRVYGRSVDNRVDPNGSDNRWLPVKVGRKLSRVLDLDLGDKPLEYGDLSNNQKAIANWLGGIYDGEGHGAFIAQDEGYNDDVRERITDSLSALGFGYVENQKSIWIQGGREEYMRFARLVRPTRLRRMDYKILSHRFKRPDEIVSIEPDGEDEAIGLETTTGNYIAWGLASKNSYWYRWALADRAFENAADPPRYVYYPTDVPWALDPEDPGLETGTPTIKHLQTLALQIGDQMRSGVTVALPGDFAMDEASGRMTSHRKWEAGYYDPPAKFEELARSFIYLDSLKFRAMLTPEQAFIEGSRGSSSGSQGGTSRLMGIQLGEVYQESQKMLADENDREINEHMIPQLVAANFPDRARTPCRKVTEGFGEYDTEIMKQVIQLVGQVKGNVLPVNIREVLSRMGIPVLSEKQQKQQLEQIAKEAEAMQPSPMQPSKVGMQGYNAGVEKTLNGEVRYFQPPQRIDLSTSNQGFLAELPDVPAYGDASVRASMMRLRRAMLERYQEQVKSFIDMLSEQTVLHLAQQSVSQQTSPVTNAPVVPSNIPAAGTPALAAGLSPSAAAGSAASIVGAWQTGRSADLAGAVIAGILLAVALRAAKRELKQAHLGTEMIDEGALERRAQQRASFIVQSIDETIREEMQTFLTDELQRETDPEKVAKDAEKRFEDTVETHAERVVLTETLPAYNYGALLALRDAGVGQVQAHDASEGRDQLTDSKCQRTNGLVMSVEEALTRSDEEHPYGTLWFSPLSTDHLRVERVATIPASLNGHGELAGYDSDDEVLYISTEASEDEMTAFLLAVGEGLRLR